MGTDEAIILIYSVLTVLSFILLWRARIGFSGITRFLNVAGVFLVGLTIFNILIYEITVQRPFFNQSQKFEMGESITDNPDIYYLIFDGYGSNQALLNYWDYDNHEFTDFLQDKGFFVAYGATVNYAKTSLSLASSLNLDYLDNLTTNFSGKDETLIYPLIENSRVVEYLKGKGYLYYHIGSWFEGTKSNTNADQNFNLKSLYLGGFFDDFTLQVLSTTSLAPVLRRLFPETNILDFVIQHKARILYQFGKLKEVVYLPGPKFVFTHILSPHQPFVFSEDCGQVSRDQSDVVTRDNFINQVECTNRKIQEMIDVLVKDGRPKVIVMQADEGVRHPRQDKIDEDGNLTPGWLKERFGILSAYLLPKSEQNETDLYQSITPVNTFRKIFNTVFAEDYQLLPDRNFIFQNSSIYDFIEVTALFKK